ncbi:TPA: hypothetical protein ACX6Q9_002874 [Photobacterium damselae]
MNKTMLILSRILEIFVSFILIKISSDYLSPTEYAKMAVFIATTQGVAWFFISPLQNYIVTNSVKLNEKGNLNLLVTIEIIYSLLISSVFTLIFLCLTDEHLTLFNYILYTIAIIVPVIYQTLLPTINIFFKIKIYIVITVIISLLTLALPTIFVSKLNDTYQVWMAGLLTPQIIGIVLLYYYANHNIFNKDKVCYKNLLKDILNFCLPLVIGIGAQWYINQGYKLQLENVFEPHMFGLFIMGFTFSGKFINAIEKVLTTAFMPDLLNRPSGTSKKDAWIKYIIKLNGLYLISFFLLLPIIKIIYTYWINDSYRAGIQYIFYGMCFDYLRCSLSSIFQFNFITNKNNYQAIFNILLASIIFFTVYLVSLNLVNVEFLLNMLPFSMLSVVVIALITNMKLKYENS